MTLTLTTPNALKCPRLVEPKSTEAERSKTRFALFGASTPRPMNRDAGNVAVRANAAYSGESRHTQFSICAPAPISATAVSAGGTVNEAGRPGAHSLSL